MEKCAWFGPSRWNLWLCILRRETPVAVFANAGERVKRKEARVGKGIENQRRVRASVADRVGGICGF